ncbi:hypothetical protein [Mycolicibacter minnesotensis]|uniref:hypothetical protein n=1 Tax=Mycolicibacter minnesotensis TaxID=1118379 RepID=UPI00138C00DA|nr:hypothetical protein [Mycolicibacter minnesotensis]BBY32900.1 hypothetical protein MMIN_09610 [Mycolicibacter minnesotensis]
MDESALRAVADSYDSTAADIAVACRIHLGGLRFDGTVAGRDYARAGESLHRAIQAWGPELLRWSRAGVEIATALRIGMERYGQAVAAATERLG